MKKQAFEVAPDYLINKILWTIVDGFNGCHKDAH